MPLDVPTLTYGRHPNRKLWPVWAILLTLGCAGGLYLISGSALSRWWSNRQSVQRVINAPSPSGTLELAMASDAPAANGSAFLMQATSRLQAWLNSTVPASDGLATMTRPQAILSPGDPGTVAFRILRTSDGSVRLVAIGVNVSVFDHGRLAILDCHVQVFAIGGFFDPHFREVKTQPAIGRGIMGTTNVGNWITFDPVRYRPGSSIVLEPPTVRSANAATIRWPIVLNGCPDALLFTLDVGDVVGLKMESGRKLPLELTPSVPGSKPSGS